MKLTLLTPTHTIVYAIAWLEINTPQGNFVIQPGHAPMIITLSSNESMIFCLENGKQESITITDGIVHINRTEILILLIT
jgi:F0F1-type ATP synthase epsilon subunit